jgi:hypothetical protein
MQAVDKDAHDCESYDANYDADDDAESLVAHAIFRVNRCSCAEI